MNGSMDISTVVFAILAIFVVWKLRSVLGTRTGNERPPYSPFDRRTPKDPNAAPADGTRGKVITLPGAADRAALRPTERSLEANRWKGYATPGSAVEAGLDLIKAEDPAFDAKGFMDGARAAYELIIQAFAKGEKDSLVPLLAPDVLEGFSRAITDREARGDTVETTFVGIDRAEIEDAQLRGGTEQIAVRFNTKLVTLTRDRSGAVIDGTPDQVSDIVDLWTFARDIESRDPNWKLVATETGE